MNFDAFCKKYRRYSVIKSSYFALESRPAYLRRLVSEWQRKDWLIELKRGMYLINEDETLRRVENFTLSNLLYEPSYVSLESALSFYGAIPEAVVQTTAVSSRKTTVIENAIGTFRYAHVKPGLFWGFTRQQLGKSSALIARPEKALLDILYLRQGSFKSGESVVESLRLQGLEQFSRSTLLAMAERFEITPLIKLASEIATCIPLKRARRK